eukprot:m.770651 g.770651  ORF g.770651 m.770651 type:complete len:618 (-) comp59084_c0_seq1:449-2302(-)
MDTLPSLPDAQQQRPAHQTQAPLSHPDPIRPQPQHSVNLLGVVSSSSETDSSDAKPAATIDPAASATTTEASSASSAATTTTATTATTAAPTGEGAEAAQTSTTSAFRDASTAPLRKLTVNLIRTYKHINTVYYAQKKSKKKEQVATYNDGYDDENHDYIVKPGEILNDRYEVKVLLGKGSFGQVAEALDQKTSKRVAVKFIKNKTAFRNQAKIEIKLLAEMNERDPNDSNHIVRLITFFEHRHHLCLVFELLSFNLYELIRHTNFKGISLNLTRKFAFQLLEALQFLSSPEISIIHCDLKPENILLKSPNKTSIKVIDFGSSCKIGKTMYPYIQSRFYRSPEVLLQIPYTQAIDMWSLGCILYELHTGDPIFNGSNEVDQMMKITEVFGIPPPAILERGQKTKRYFKAPEEASGWERIKLEKEYKPLCHKKIADMIGANTDGPRGLRRGEMGHTRANYEQFEDLLRKLLCFDPEQRLTPTQALRHDFFTRPAHIVLSSVPRAITDAQASSSSSARDEASTTSSDATAAPVETNTLGASALVAPAAASAATTTSAAEAHKIESPDMFKETASKKYLPESSRQTADAKPTDQKVGATGQRRDRLPSSKSQTGSGRRSV